MINASKSAITAIAALREADTLYTDDARKPSRASLVGRNIVVNGRRTSMRIESVLWDAMTMVCNREELTVSELCSRIEKIKGQDINLTAAVRTFLVAYFRCLATEQGHAKAGHGTIPDGDIIPVPPIVDPLSAILGEVVH